MGTPSVNIFYLINQLFQLTIVERVDIFVQKGLKTHTCKKMVWFDFKKIPRNK